MFEVLRKKKVYHKQISFSALIILFPHCNKIINHFSPTPPTQMTAVSKGIIVYFARFFNTVKYRILMFSVASVDISNAWQAVTSRNIWRCTVNLPTT